MADTRTTQEQYVTLNRREKQMESRVIGACLPPWITSTQKMDYKVIPSDQTKRLNIFPKYKPSYVSVSLLTRAVIDTLSSYHFLSLKDLEHEHKKCSLSFWSQVSDCRSFSLFFFSFSIFFGARSVIAGTMSFSLALFSSVLLATASAIPAPRFFVQTKPKDKKQWWNQKTKNKDKIKRQQQW